MRSVGSSRILATLAALSFAPYLHADPGTDFFEKKIRPVLVDQCYSCHSEQAKKDRGGLRVDSREALLKGGDSGPAIVVGKPGESLLIKAMHYSDNDLRMPPKKKLDGAVVADFEKWVKMGAPDPRTRAAGGSKSQTVAGADYWSFRPIVKTTPPMPRSGDWAKGDIDRFLLAKLDSKGLKPAKNADKATVLRRAYFVLIGLPPSPAEIEAYLKDSSPDAFVKVVDQLIASPRFGERWGRHWLDVARYADTSGGGRSLMFRDAWRYRDYVIDAVNADMPFDRFILEQIAGDLLDAKSPEERRRLAIATAFLLLGPANYERQDKPILEMDIIDEQIDTIGKGLLGMTIGCARCHDHKFDPIPTADYYALAGIFKSTKFIVHDNVSKWNEVKLPAPLALEAASAKAEKRIAELKIAIQKLKGKAGDASTAKGAVDPEALPGIVLDDSDAQKVGPWKHSTFTGAYVGKGYLYDDVGTKSRKSLTFIPTFTKSGVYEVRLAYVPYKNRATKVPVRVFHADGDATVTINQQETPAVDGRFVSLGKFRFEKGNQWFVMISTDGANGHVVADAVQFLPEELAAAPVVKSAPAGEGKKSSAPSLAQLEAELKKATAAAPSRETAMAVTDAPKATNLHICIRGNFHNKGPDTPRGFLRVVAPTPAKGSPFVIGPNDSGRKQLALWLTSPKNPLTPRVAVNRLWSHVFGQGIVASIDNFGSTGEKPANPELLDYLAARFMEQGWSVKKMVREMILSQAFQMADVADPASLKADPDNAFLSRMNRRRMEAEEIRDTILAVSGKLEFSAGGPSIPKSLARERDHNFTEVCRSVFAPVFRNKLQDIFEVFDFADPNVTTSKRNASNVPTQALFLMNNPFVMEQARHAGARIFKFEQTRNESAAIRQAFLLTLGRAPSTGESKLIQEALTGDDRTVSWERVMHSLIASNEFRYLR